MSTSNERKLKTFAVKIDAWQKLEDLKHQLETIEDRIYLLKEFDNEEAEELRAQLIITLQTCAGMHQHRSQVGL